MAAGSIEQMADRVAALMEQRLRLRGTSLADKLRRGRRALPRRIRAEAAVLAEAARHATNPRLLPQVDHDRAAQAHDTCLRYLQEIDRFDRRKAAVLGIAGSIAFRLFAVGLLVLTVLWVRGLL